MFKGKAIYNPSGKAGEYSYWACNFYKGCSNGCTYCFLKKGILCKELGGNRPELKKCFKDREHAKTVFEKELLQNVDELRKHGLFLTFTSDPFLPETFGLTYYALSSCLKNNVPVKLLTKNNPLVYYDFHKCSEFAKQNIAFGFTLTGHDEFEPYAVHNVERIKAMKFLNIAGFKTWASIEPVIDTNSSLDMIEKICNRVDLIKVGLQSGKKYDTDNLKSFLGRIWTLADVYRFKVYIKDSLLKALYIERHQLPSAFCVDRDYNLFKL